MVLFGDVVHSRRCRRRLPPPGLSSCRLGLDDRYRDERLAEFEFTQGDEIQGLLAPRPTRSPPCCTPRSNATPARRRAADALGRSRPAAWIRATARRRVEPATRSSGSTGIRVPSEPGRMAFAVEPVMRTQTHCSTDWRRCSHRIIDAMTDRQREVARLALVEGLRQSEIADRLGVARATVSVSWARGGVRNLGRLVRAIRAIWSEGVERAAPMRSAV